MVYHVHIKVTVWLNLKLVLGSSRVLLFVSTRPLSFTPSCLPGRRFHNWLLRLHLSPINLLLIIRILVVLLLLHSFSFAVGVS